MPEYKSIPVANLQMDTSNYRIGRQENQGKTRHAIIGEQGKKLVFLANDIIKFGLSPFDIPMVYPADGGNGIYVMLEGNRRLTAIKLVQEPELAKGTELHRAFKQLHGKNSDDVPTEIFCAIIPDRETGLMWIRRKHDKGLKGAGTEDWSAIAKERADADEGRPTPVLSALDFVAANATLEPNLKKIIVGRKFPITNLERILETTYVKEALGLQSKDGALSSNSDEKWLLGVLTDVVTAVATKHFEGEKFNVATIEGVAHRKSFIDKVIGKHPKPKGKASEWVISGGHKVGAPASAAPAASTAIRSTPTTGARKTIVPPRTRLPLPDGKINNVFDELKKLDAGRFTNASAALLRMFVEFSANAYLKKHTISLPKHSNGKDKDALINKLDANIDHMIANKIMPKKELNAIKAEIHKPHSIFSPDILNSYLHNQSFSADPLELKRTWDNLQAFIEKMWA